MDKKQISKYISNGFGLGAIVVIFLIGVSIVKSINIIHFDFTDKILSEVTETSSGEVVEEESSDKINILLVGRGGGDHDAPNLTDTLILSSINTHSKTISMFSIPRDLYVDYGNGKSGKINEVYINNAAKTASKTDGMNALKEKITQITGEKVHYFANIDFNGFMEVVDALGGIVLDVPETLVDDRYPDGEWGYKTLIFKKGKWLFDGENALKYARSRHSTSDFDRSLRQQQILTAVKEKLTASYFIKSPTKLKELYDIAGKYVHTDLGLADILKLAYTMKNSGEYEVLSFNLNDSCFYGSDTCDVGGFLYVPNREFFNGMSVLLADGTDKSALNNYDVIQKFTDMIFNHPQMYVAGDQIHIYNSLRVNHLAGALSNDVKRYGFNIPSKGSIGNTNTVYEKSIIYYNSLEDDSPTLNILKGFFEGEFKKVEAPMYSKDPNTKIEIIIGADYIDARGRIQEVFYF